MTRSTIAPALLALALGAASPAHAEAVHVTNANTAAATKTGTGVGIIRSIDQKAGTVTIQHGPIAAIGWPAMTMAFKAHSPAVLRAARVGRTIAFGVRVSGTSAEVTSIAPK